MIYTLNSEFSEPVLDWIEYASWAIEILAVVIIVVAVFFGTTRYIYSILSKQGDPKQHYFEYKKQLGRSLLLGLEILVAADVIRTVALESTLESVINLGLLIVVRTFLSWALSVEIEGRWPWQFSQKKDLAG